LRGSLSATRFCYGVEGVAGRILALADCFAVDLASVPLELKVFEVTEPLALIFYTRLPRGLLDLM